VREWLAQRVREPLTARLLLAIETATDEDPSLRGWLVDFDAEVLERLRALFARLGVVPPADELALFHAGLAGAALLGAHGGTPASAERAARVVRLAFDRLLQPATPQDR
jgi:hypothetical protein